MRRFKKVGIVAAVVALGACLLALLNVALDHLVVAPGMLDPVIRITLLAAIVSLCWIGYNIAREWISRLEAEPPAKGTSEPKWASFCVFVVVTLLGAGVFALTLVPLVQLVLAAYHVPYLNVLLVQQLAYSSVAPLYIALLLGLMWVKVRFARALDEQKIWVRDLCQSHNRWEASLDRLRHLNPKDAPGWGHEDRRSFQGRLDVLCECALKAASRADIQWVGQRSMRAAVLYLADQTEGVFRPVATAGGVRWYWDALGSSPIAMLNVDRFLSHYNQYNDRIADMTMWERRRRDRHQMLQDFRDEVRGFCSSAGLVFELERKLAFDRPYRRCLTHSFRYVEELSHVNEDEKDRVRWQQAIAIPVLVFGRRVGVFVLSARKRLAFYTSDKIYWIIGDLLACAVERGIVLGFFSDYGLKDILESAPRPKEAAKIDYLVRSLNQLRYDFDTRHTVPSSS